jgi:hypothetical protein
VTTYTVSDVTGANSAIAGASPGDVIQFQDAGTFNTGDIIVTGKSNLTLIGQTRRVPSLQRVYLTNSTDITIEHLTIQMVGNPQDYVPGVMPPLIRTNGNTDGLRVIDNLIRCGNYLDSYNPFDPTDKTLYVEYVADWATNTEVTLFCASYPKALAGDGYVQGSLTIEDNTIEDMGGDALKFSYQPATGSSLKIRRNIIQRVYQDFMSIAFPNNAFAEMAIVDVSGNLVWDNFCQVQDFGGHGDLLQFFVAGNGLNLSVLKNWFIGGNLFGMTPGARGAPQKYFISDFNNGYPVLGPIFIDNLLIGRVVNKGIQIAGSNPTCGAAGALIYRNALLSFASWNYAFDNEVTGGHIDGVLSGDAISPASVTDTDINILRDPNFSGKNLVGYNVAESIIAQAGMDNATYPNRVVPRGTPANLTAYSAVYGAIDWGSDLTTPEGYISTFTPVAEFADYGPVRPGQTLAEFLAKWSSDTKPLSEIPSYIGFDDTLNLTPGATGVMSEWTFVQAGMETRALTVTGGELQWAPDDNGAPDLGSVSAWITTGTLDHGVWARVRRDAAATYATREQVAVTLGSQTSYWSMTTLDPNTFPVAVFDGTQLVRQNSTELFSASATGLVTLVVHIDAAAPASTVSFTGASAGSAQFGIQLLTNGRLRAFGPGCEVQVAGVLDGNPHTVVICWDTSQTTAAAGVQVALDFVATNPASTGTWTQGQTIGGGSTPAGLTQIGGSLSTPAFTGGVGLFALYYGVHPGAFTDQDNIDKFRASYIGPAGEGPFGVSQRVFLVGSATTWDSGDPNAGTGVAWSKAVGNTLTAGDANPWPPNLYMVSEQLTTTGLTVGLPITLRVTALGFPKAGVTVTAASDKAGTWDAASVDLGQTSNAYIDFVFTPSETGLHTISWTNDGGYNDPTDISFTVTGVEPASYAQDADDTSVALGSPITVTYTLDAAAVDPITLTPDSTLAGTFFPTTVVIGAGETTGQTVFTASTPGTGALSVTNNATLPDPADISFTITQQARASRMKLRGVV